MKLITAVIFIFALSGQNLSASEQSEWNFEITPYFLAAGLEGDIGLNDVTTEIDMSFSDIWDHLDAGFMGLFSAQNDRWILGFEAVYFKLSGAGSKSVTWDNRARSNQVDGAIELTSKMSIYSATVGYRVIDETTKMDLLGGLRYTDIEADVDVAINGVFSGPLLDQPFSGALSASGSKSWTDAVVGVRAIHPVADNLDLVGYLDVGGGDDSNTWQAIAGVNWHFKKDYTAKFGYRVLDWDYDDGNFVWDMQSAGMYAGLGIAF